jgi:hypothetical protein
MSSTIDLTGCSKTASAEQTVILTPERAISPKELPVLPKMRASTQRHQSDRTCAESVELIGEEAPHLWPVHTNLVSAVALQIAMLFAWHSWSHV